MKTTHSNDRINRTLARTAGLLALIVVSATLVACNATKGLGQDLEESSDNVKKAAEK
ncbi:MAG: hypothetical protein U0570_10060 [Phycisphaerales bacterium]